MPSNRWDSLKKLSSFFIFCIAAFVQPSDPITLSTSSRIGSIYSGRAARWNNACVKLCICSNKRLTRWSDLQKKNCKIYHRGCMDSHKINREHALCQSFDSSLLPSRFIHEPREHIVLKRNQQEEPIAKAEFINAQVYLANRLQTAHIASSETR